MLKDAFRGFNDDNVFKLSGSLAYFTVFSIGPMLIVMIFFADLFYGREAVEGTVYGQIKGFVGPDAAAQIQQIIKSATLSGKSTITAIVGFLTLLIGATTVFAEIQDSVNTIWNLKPKPKKRMAENDTEQSDFIFCCGGTWIYFTCFPDCKWID